MIIRKQLIQQIKEENDYQPVHRISQTLQYKHEESIQEEEEHSSLSQVCQLRPTFLQTFPQQPIDIQSSDDYKPPTITHLQSHKSSEKVNYKNQYIENSLLSSLSSKLLSDHKRSLVDQNRQKLLNSIHYSKYNDPLVTQEQTEASPFKYYYFTFYMFASTFLSNLATIIFIPTVRVFEFPMIIAYVIFGFKLITIIQDLYFQRGPYKLYRGKVIQNFKDNNKVCVDLLRLILLIVNTFIEIDNNTLILFIILLFIFDLLRIFEPFENIYKSTHYLITIIQIWIAIIISLACCLKIFDEEDHLNLSMSITYSISLLTHNGQINITENNSNIITIYLIITYICYVYTSIVLLIWLKPDIEIQEEKQKLLKGFVELFREKCKDYDLLRRCYSYLEFRIDEDLGRAKDQLAKKLSPALQDEIDLSLRTIMIDRIQLMSKFSPPFKQQLLYAIEQVTFNPEDNIIIEHQIEDLGLYYILKGEVKVQFQGSSLANGKRSVTRLQEGQAFGQYSFISGVPSNISIYSVGVTTLMKIKRSDFMEIINNFPTDNELFCMMKDNSFYNQHLFDCYYCKIKGHYISECQHIQYFPQRQNVIEKYLYTKKQNRIKFNRKQKKYLTFKNLQNNQEKMKQFYKNQEIMSEDLPEASQLPYSENQTYSVSYVSNSIQQQKGDQYVSNSNVNVDSLEQFNDEYEEQQLQQQQQQQQQTQQQIEQLRQRQRQNTNKASHKTAGFVVNPQYNNSQLDKDERDILSQLQESIKPESGKQLLSRNSPNKLTFQFQREISSTSKQDIIKQEQIQLNLKQRQLTNRSHTYTNSQSKDKSLPSSNSKNRKDNRNSIQTQSDENRFKSKTNTKQSNLGVQSQFQALTTQQNQEFYDVMFNKFDSMKQYHIYYPHNNYDRVLARLFQGRKKQWITPYSIKCYVATRIHRVQRLIRS